MIKTALLLLTLSQVYTDPDLPPIKLQSEIRPVALGRLVKLAVEPVDRAKYPTIKTINYEWVVTELKKSNDEPIGTDLDIDRLDETIAKFGSGISPTYVKVTVIGIYNYGDRIKRARKDFEIPIGSTPPTPVPTPPTPTPTPTPVPPAPASDLKSLVKSLYANSPLNKSDAASVAQTASNVAQLAKNQSWNARETVSTFYSNVQEALGANYSPWLTNFFTPLNEYLNKNPAKTPNQAYQQLLDIAEGLK